MSSTRQFTPIVPTAGFRCIVINVTYRMKGLYTASLRLVEQHAILPVFRGSAFDEPAEREASDRAGSGRQKILSANELPIAVQANAADATAVTADADFKQAGMLPTVIERKPAAVTRGSDRSDIAPALSIGLDSRSGRRPYDVIPQLCGAADITRGHGQ
jgi:hypothetical protein